MAGVDAFLFLDKGSAKQSLLDARREILDRYAPQGYRLIEIDDPPRDRNPADYAAEVRRWHAARASAIEQVLLDEIGEGGVAAFLVWGDPALYDSTLRIVDDIAERGVLAPRSHRDPRRHQHQRVDCGAPDSAQPESGADPHHHRSTSREHPMAPRNQVVMLDSFLAFRETAYPDDHIWWGCLRRHRRRDPDQRARRRRCRSDSRNP